MQEKIINLLEQLNPKSSDLEKLLGLNSGTLYSYTRKTNKRNIPVDVQDKLKKYLLVCADFIKSELSDTEVPKETTEVLKNISIKKSNNPSLIKDKSRYYPDGSGYVHFTIDSKYYMTNDSECTIDGKTYEFNPATKIAGMMSEKYVPTVRPKIDLPTATVQLPDPQIKAFVSTDITLPNTVESKPIDSPLILSKDLFRLDGIADETAL